LNVAPAAFLAQATLLPAQAYDIIIEQIRHIAQPRRSLALERRCGAQALFAALIRVALIKSIAGFSGWGWNPMAYRNFHASNLFGVHSAAIH
jgi:hypothetical protein